ncbi:MAG: PAS domain-containing protein [Bdellovibrionota bacterium]
MTQRLERFIPKPVGPIAGITLAAASVAALIGVRFALEAQFTIVVPFSLFFIAVIFCSWFGGFISGLTATLLGIAAFFFTSRGDEAAQSAAGLAIRIAIYAIDGILVSGVCALLQDQFRRSRNLDATAMEARLKSSTSEERFKTLFENIPQIIFVTDADGTMSQYNQHWYKYTGIPLEAPRDERAKAIHPDDVEGVFASVEAAAEAGVPWSHEYRIRRHDGVYRWHLGSSVPIKDERGKTIRRIGHVVDIEQQKREAIVLEKTNVDLEKSVRESLQELRNAYAFAESVLENIPNMIFVKDAKDLRFVRFNRAGENLLGMTRDKLMGKNDYDFFPPAEAKHFQDKDREVLAGREIIDIAEESISTARGETRILHTKKIPIVDENGEPKYLVGISEDITDKKKLEDERMQLVQSNIEKQESEKSAERLDFLAQASAVLGSSLDLEGTLTNLTKLIVPTMADWCSVQLLQADGTLKQLAVSHSDPAKVKWALEFQAKYPPDPNAPAGPHHVVRTGKSELIAEVDDAMATLGARGPEHRRLIEELGFKSYLCSPIRRRGEIIGALALMTTKESDRHFSEADLHLTEELCARAGIAVDNAKLYREAQTLNRVKDEFLATLSHELRTPINVIQGHTDLVLAEFDELGDEDLKESLLTIQRNTRLQTQIVSDLLDVSSIITGKISYVPQETSPADAVNAVVEAIKPTANNKGVTVTAKTEGAKKSILADPTRLHQIIWNLVNNAVKFTPPGGTVVITAENDAGFCTFTVRDDGLGIKREFLPFVFDRFSQADSSMSRKFGGLGLGLSIVKNLAEIHGGTVSVASDGTGKGSTFVVRLPVRTSYSYSVPSLDAASRAQVASIESGSSLENLRILLVEDSLDNRILVTRMLKKAGAEVLEAESAAAAREILKSTRPDIIVSDIGMPDENGLQFMRRFRSEHLEDSAASIPAIALTAYVRPEEIDEALAAGFQAHISKPVTRPLLVNEIAKWANVRRDQPART